MAQKITADQRKQLAEDHEKATLLKESLKIVEDLGKLGTASGYEYDDETIENLIDRAEKLRKHKGQEKGKDAAQGAFFAIWVLIAFVFGGWAISWLFVNAGNLADVLAKNLNINVGWLLFSPFIIVFIIGRITNFRNKTKPPASPFH